MTGRPARHAPGVELKAAARRRQEALERFNAWEKAHPADPAPAASLSAIGLLYDLLPTASRSRPLDPSGVRKLHRCLSVLTRH